MDLIVLPQALLIFYGFLVLGCGSVLGFILARNVKRALGVPDPPDLLERRVSMLERELEETRADLVRLQDESAFLRELSAPGREPEGARPLRPRFIA